MADINKHLLEVSIDGEVREFVYAGLEDMRDTINDKANDFLSPVWRHEVRNVHIQPERTTPSNNVGSVIIEDSNGDFHCYRVIVEKL